MRRAWALMAFGFGIVMASGPVIGAFTPNDPDWNNVAGGAVEWWAQDFSDGAATANGMNFDEAWDQNAMAGQGDSFGDDSILVAVLDCLFGQWAQLTDMHSALIEDDMDNDPPGDADGDGNHDDDDNGEVDDHNGWDYVEDDNWPYYQGTQDDADDCSDGTHGWGEAHGASVVGVLGAQIDNGVLIAGASKVKILPIRVISSEQTLAEFVTALVNGIDYASRSGADVITMSLGCDNDCHDMTTTPPTDLLTPAQRSAVSTALANAYGNGIVITAAVGNDGPGSCVEWPATDPSVIAVGASTNNLAPAGFSCSGPKVEVAAPGEGLRTLVFDIQTSAQSSDDLDGTSFATPAVAAVAALLKSYRNDLTASQIRQIIAASTHDIWLMGRDDDTGFGNVDADLALKNAQRTRDFVWRTNEVIGWNAAANVAPNLQPAADINPWGITESVYLSNVGGAVSQVIYQEIDQTGQSWSGLIQVEQGTPNALVASEYVDIFSDTQNFNHIAWIEGNDIYYTRRGPGNGVDLAITKITIQGVNGLNGAISNLNVMATPKVFNPWPLGQPDDEPTLYFVYDQNLGGAAQQDVMFFPMDWMVTAMPAGYPMAVHSSNQNDLDPSADIVENHANQCGAGQPYCIYVAHECSAQHVICAFEMDTTGVVVANSIRSVDPTGVMVGQYEAYNPSIDIDPLTGDAALTWDLRDFTAAGLGAWSVRLAWLNNVNLVMDRGPMYAGQLNAVAPNTGPMSPTVSVTPHGHAGVVWSEGTSVLYSEVTREQVPITESSTGSFRVRVASGAAATPFPQIVSAKRITTIQAITYDVSDGNYRFTYIGNTPTGISSLLRAGTRPTFRQMEPMANPATTDARNVDIAYDDQGGTHMVYQQKVNNKNEIKYLYWQPGTAARWGAGLGPTAINVASQAGVNSESPRVHTLFYGAVEPGFVKVRVMIFYIHDAGAAGSQLYVTIYEIGPNGGGWAPVMRLGPVRLAADNVNAAEKVVEFDQEGYQDHPDSLSMDFSVAQPQPKIAFAWRELNPNTQTTTIYYGSLDANNIVLQPESSVKTTLNNDKLSGPSVGQGNWNRAYVAYVDSSGALPIAKLIRGDIDGVGGAFAECWNLNLNGGNEAYQAVIQVSREFETDYFGRHYSSDTEVSDSPIHVALSTKGVGVNRYDVKYQRVEDREAADCGGGGRQVIVHPISVVPASGPGENYESPSKVLDIEMVLTRDNRPILVYSAERDTSVQFTMGARQLFVTGLSGHGTQDMFTEMELTKGFMSWDALGAHIDISYTGMVGIVYHAGSPLGANANWFPEYHEAAPA